MGNNHQKLLQLVEAGQLHIIAVVGTQRSGSTITAKALGQIYDITLDGAFSSAAKIHYPGKARFNITDEIVYEDFCKTILDRVSAHTDTKTPVHVVVKGTSRRMAPNIFSRWVELPSSFLVTFRDPAAQFISLARAFHSRDICGIRTPEPVTKFIEEILPSIETEHYPRFEGNMLDANYMRWQGACNEISIIREACKQRASTSRPAQVAFMEATLMRFSPYQTWFSVFDRLGLAPENTDRLLKAPWNIDISSENQRKSAFKAKVSDSRAIDPLSKDDRIDIDSLSAKSRGHIESLMPIYLGMLDAPENAYLPSLEALEGFCYGTTIKLADASPLVAQSVLSLHPEPKTLAQLDI